MQLTKSRLCLFVMLSLSSSLVSCSPANTMSEDTTAKTAEQITEQERLARVERDFQWTESMVRNELAKLIPDYTNADFERWDSQGLLEHQRINGEKRYFNRAVSNLFYLDADARDRRIEPKHWYYSTLPLYQVHPHHLAVLSNDDTTKRIRISYTL